MSIIRKVKDSICAVAYAYCKDEPSEIENYELAKADNFEGWVIHHRDEIKVLPSGIKVIRTSEDLIESGRYFHCPANELIFMKRNAHLKLHSNNMSDTHKLNISKGVAGHKATNKVKCAMSDTGKLHKGQHWKVVNGHRVWYKDE